MDAIAAELTCPICLEVMQDPRLLSCDHSACASCLVRIAQGNKINCPICRRVTTNNAQALPSNRQLAAVCSMLRSGGKPAGQAGAGQQQQAAQLQRRASAPPAQGFEAAPQQWRAASFHGQPSAAPPPAAGQARSDLDVIFDLVDEDRDGRINETELRSALLNDDNTPFDMNTIRTLFAIVDTDRNRLIDRNEFVSLYQLLQSWRAVFEQQDRDRSGTIDRNELWQSLCALGFRMDGGQFGQVEGKYCRGGVMKLDAFLRCCIELRTAQQTQQGQQPAASSFW